MPEYTLAADVRTRGRLRGRGQEPRGRGTPAASFSGALLGAGRPFHLDVTAAQRGGAVVVEDRA